MSWILYLSLTLCLMVQTAPGARNTKEPLVVTKYGTLQGKQMGKTSINVFLGVPFSRPPVGVRRCLQESWRQITFMYFDTWKQYKLLRVSEDCLYLKVYAAVRARGDAPLPELAAGKKVVLVLLQQRLGILGFLSTGDSQARGNWALLDQVAALRWVQENIAAFGGDPGCMTLFGQSSGAMCISGLAISQSGTAALRSFITADSLKVAKLEEYLSDIDDHDWKMLTNHVMDLVGDTTFVYPTLQAARHHRDAGFPVYLYELEHHTPTGVIVKPRTDGGRPRRRDPLHLRESFLQRNPNGGKLPHWPRYHEEEKYLQMDFIMRVGMKLKEEKMAFWMRPYQH